MKVEKRFHLGIFIALALLAAGAVAQAQQTPLPEKSTSKPGDLIIFEREIGGPQPGTRIRTPLPSGDDTMVFLSSEMSFDGKVVKGAPYSADAITESTRTLSDGNRIKSKTTASIYRDSEGRTRRDQELGAVGPWAMAGEPQQTVFINDPVTGVNYVLDPRTHTARKMAPFRISIHPGEGTGAPEGSSKVAVEVEQQVFTARLPAPHGGGAPMQEFHINTGPAKGETESLGKQTIEGVVADGTRTTSTIPAGEVGNEQPIKIVWEKWYSPELQTVVMTRHSDPFVGETTYRLTNIVRGEPARSLFEVPADYTIKELPTNTRIMRRKPADEK
ncbi:MAG: hypothetical protein QOJ64_1011 [Acidobacteriota bacterium]|jgi:hypothetical protein|nr:hypothetical protein [Acidobacteriota bacterium]